MYHVVMYSGGIGSWAAAKRVAEQHGTEKLVMLFSDTKTEDEDLYRFLKESCQNVGGRIKIIADGRDVWEVFNDVRFLGNSRIDPCSRILKRDLCRKWVDKNFSSRPDQVRLYVGIDWTEGHRMKNIVQNWVPYQVEAPMLAPPHLTKKAMLAMLEAEGIAPPRLYGMGFSHNNCGGFCIKSGQAQFELLLKSFPERYAYHEQKEREIREKLNKNVSILRHHSGPDKGKPWTLEDFRKNLEGKGSFDKTEWGGCGCFI